MHDADSSPPALTRRRLLAASALGLTTTLAGCSNVPNPLTGNSGYEPIETTSPPTDNNDPNDTVTEPPSEPPARIKLTDGSDRPTWGIDRFEGTPATDLTDLVYGHWDERAVPVIANESEVRVTFTALLRRALEFTLYIRDRNHEYHTYEQRLDKPDGPETYREYELIFDISDVPLPRNAGSYLELIFTDSHPALPYEYIFRRHQFVGVEHPDGTRWFNDDEINQMNYYNGNKYIRTNPLGFTATEDHGDKRTVFLLCRTNVNGELFGVATQVDKGFVAEYRRASERWRDQRTYRWEVHSATEVSHLRDLAEKTHAAITAIGITDSYDRLQALGDLIQMIPYGTPVQEWCPPIIVLHETLGDCDEKSALLAGILANDPWNTRTAYIEGEINGGRHFTIGIDDRDFEVGNHGIHWVDDNLHSSLPDARYAYFEMTADTALGAVTASTTAIEGIYATGTFKHRYNGASTPPSY